MRNRTVVVTGVGARGQVGYAVAEAFLERGARLLLVDVRPEVEDLARTLSDRGHVHAVQADLSGETGASTVVGVAVERYGGIDVLVNVAGGLSVIENVAETTPDQWKREIERNATTAYHMMRAALPRLRESGGCIVNFASPAGTRAVAKMGAYSAAKAAVVALTRATALEEQEHGVRVNAIAPGMVDTEENRASAPDADRSGWVTREEIAAVVLFLADDASSGITGTTIPVPGGPAGRG